MRIFYLFPLFIVLISCSATKNTAFINNIQKSTCNQENSYSYTKSNIPIPLHELEIDSLLFKHFNERDLNVANAISVLGLLEDYIQKMDGIKDVASLNDKIELIQIRQELNDRIDLASLEISAVTAELDCEEERLSQIASYLSDKEKQKEKRLTVTSIILGSLSAIVTGILITKSDRGNTADLIGVGVGVADAALGVLLLTSNRKINLEHKRNVLRELWLGTETSTSYPPSIWYYLNYNPVAGTISLRERLINNWNSFGQIREMKNNPDEDLEIYFGDGGKYTIDELENRANMYDQIESQIKLMKQDLRNLKESIISLKENK